jgi:hypothetical protein
VTEPQVWLQAQHYTLRTTNDELRVIGQGAQALNDKTTAIEQLADQIKRGKTVVLMLEELEALRAQIADPSRGANDGFDGQE